MECGKKAQVYSVDMHDMRLMMRVIIPGFKWSFPVIINEPLKHLSKVSQMEVLDQQNRKLGILFENRHVFHLVRLV